MSVSNLLTGEALWDIDDPRTWHDYDGEETEDPMGETDNLYLQVLDKEEEDEAAKKRDFE